MKSFFSLKGLGLELLTFCLFFFLCTTNHRVQLILHTPLPSIPPSQLCSERQWTGIHTALKEIIDSELVRVGERFPHLPSPFSLLLSSSLTEARRSKVTFALSGFRVTSLAAFASSGKGSWDSWGFPAVAVTLCMVAPRLSQQLTTYFHCNMIIWVYYQVVMSNF